MPIMDLSLVTGVLAETIRRNITERLDPGLAGQLNVTTLPPERLSGEMFTINVYLYHLAEDANYRNLTGNPSDRNPVVTQPMSLLLNYIVTTHHEVDSLFDTITQQRLMGYALKTLHDFPVIGDHSEINGTPLLPDDMRGRDNALEVVLQPVTPEQSINFWTAEDRATTRLSAFYEVRYVMLEPEPPRRLPGLVLSIGNFIVDIASPQLAATASQLDFVLPALAGGGAQRVQAAPARVGQPIAALPDSNRLSLRGSNLGIGRRRTLHLANGRWRTRVPALERVPVDPALPQNTAAGWTVTEAADHIELTMGTTLTVARPAGPPLQLPVEPGSYNASVQVVKQSQVVLGQLKEITDTSNSASFSVMARVLSVTVLDPVQRRIQVNLDPSLDLSPPSGPGLPGALDIVLVVNGENYLRHDPAAPGATFDVGDFEPFHDTLVFRSRFDPAVPGTYTLRVIVEGAESQPFWMELP